MALELPGFHNPGPLRTAKDPVNQSTSRAIPSTPGIGDLATYCEGLAMGARAAARLLATARGDEKNQFLEELALALTDRNDEILEANRRDLVLGAELGLTGAVLDRLQLTPERLRATAAGVREVVGLPDPVGRVLDSSMRPNGLQVLKVGVPLGVIFFIYESRPNVTVDAAALCIKSGNALILRGGKEAIHSNVALCTLIRDCLSRANLPQDAVQLVETPERGAVGELLRLNTYIDLTIPRGGESLIRRVAAEATMPVLKHYKGNCHVYVDVAADLEMAARVLLNAKCQRPGVCNAAESLLVHGKVAPAFLPRAAASLREQGVELRGCSETRRLVPDCQVASEDDFAAEYLDLILSIKVVESLQAAIEHINRYGSQHTDAIITADLTAARRFTASVDSAAVLVNASTRFHDGYEFGLGAEIGISTDKIHARGPCGLLELTSYKYVVFGDGQVRS
jgi:glutamate-5-semialdehyde dehydrogenase